VAGGNKSNSAKVKKRKAQELEQALKQAEAKRRARRF